ncbi:site-specific integrase [Flavobacterium sp.]|uniref:tyrosine-type recombinase/integrase n=1 Tax=Flavobacterium sp. TaxID=239 RepID=UPI0025C1A2B7|nr:site-specific integrase [Flavobacterium sp.]MBA4154141.1 integrase [Flavobacterium sp.]
MKNLKNGCSYSELWVSPEDWRTTTAKSSLKKQWYVQCYYYDPLFADKYPKGFPFRKKLNRIKTLEQRKEAVKFFLEEIPKLFEDKLWNPITKNYMAVEEDIYNYDINPNTKIIDAIRFVLDRLEIETRTIKEIRNIVDKFERSVKNLRFQEISVIDFKRKHYKLVIENIEKIDGKFSAHKYNKYRSYISILFRDLLEYEAVEYNIMKDIRKKTTEKKIREILSEDERKQVNQFLKEHYPDFWRFTIIFFHSGGRITELLRLQIKDVDIKKQVYRTLIKKGNQSQWIERPIKDIAVHLWQRSIFGRKEDYVFSTGLKPGPEIIAYKNIQRRWKMHVKDKLEVTADFYALKHLNLDETAELLSLEDAARLAGHTDTKMVLNHYAVGEESRKLERLKKLNNKFA